MMDRLTVLATNINNGVNQLVDYLAENDLPHPSFDPDAPANLQLSPEAQGAAFAAMDAAQELYDLIRGPRELLIDHIFSPLAAYDLILRFGIAHKVPLDGHIGYSDLATATGVEESALTRILRYGTLYRLFQEKEPGYISHSTITKLMAVDDLQRNMVGMILQDIWPPHARLADALGKWPGADEPTQTAFVLAENSGLSFFSTLNLDPQREARFVKTMRLMSIGENLADDYAWEALGNGMLVDLGGATGDTAFNIAEKHSSLNIVVQDVPEVIAGANQRDGCRVSFMEHDFFEEQPVKDANAYMLRWCLHDWSNKYCIRILRALIPAMRPGVKLLIIDAIVPPFGSLPNTVQRRMCQFDLTMLGLFNGKERTLDEWKELFVEADARYRFQKVVPLTNSHLAVLELEWVIT